MVLPTGTKPSVTESSVLRGFAANIRTAATTRSSDGRYVSSYVRAAWIDAWERIRRIEGRAALAKARGGE